MAYFAHVAEDGRKQTVREHLTGVAEKAAEFARPFGGEKQAAQIGMAHDIGKFSAAFQRRLLENGSRVDHSTAGAVELIERRDLVGAFCAAGHHAGLADCGTPWDTADQRTLQGRVKRKEKLADYSAFRKEISWDTSAWSEEQESAASSGTPEEQYSDAYYRTKFQFSCLVDADFLDTGEFMDGKSREMPYDSVETLQEKLARYTEKWQHPTSELNRIRCDILRTCTEAGEEDRGLKSLTTPTGGGKTVASLSFALGHARKHGMQRIVYIIPYISIIDQTAKTLEEIFGRENVLAHYSEAEYDDDDIGQRKKLAAENWDAPVIVTTSVQFFESLFSHRPSKSRKIHNIADSVLIFDEYQMIPVKNMLPCTDAIYHLIRDYRCTALLCTATQPGTERFFHGMPCRELIEDPPLLFERLQRVTYRQMGMVTDQELAEALQQHDQVLCIVNTRKSAQNIYQLMVTEGTFHLSTYMIPKHRRSVLEEIRLRLKQNLPCRVVSTSLIEAGVDVDFPAVFREENGLDSIVQAAGRCNREGKRSREESKVYIFQLDSVFLRLQRMNRDAMREVLASGLAIESPKTTQKYFQTLFDLKGEEALDAENILKLMRKGGKNGPLPFRTISERFHMIDQDTKNLYVPADADGEELIRRMAEGERSRELFRLAGQYSVSLYPQVYADLEAEGVIFELDESVAILNNCEKYYSERTGLKIPAREEGNGWFL